MIGQILYLLARAGLRLMRPLIRMATDIDESFIRQYQKEVHLLFQREGSMLRGTVRSVSNVTGVSTTFQVMGRGRAVEKPRHGDIEPMNVSHRPVPVMLRDKYAADYVDELDQLKTAHDERTALVQTGVYALGRAVDEQIFTAINAGTNTTPVGGAGLTIAKFLAARTALAKRDAFVRGMTYLAVGPEQWAELAVIPQFASQDYVDRSELPFRGDGMSAKMWAGVMVFEHTQLGQEANMEKDTGLTSFKSGRNRTIFMWNKRAIGHAIGCDVKSNIDRIPEKYSYFVANAMSMGAGLIDGDGVQKIVCQEAA